LKPRDQEKLVKDAKKEREKDKGMEYFEYKDLYHKLKGTSDFSHSYNAGILSYLSIYHD
jgi:hypothetical protein